MTIKSSDGSTHDVTGKGMGGTALGLGIAGTTLGLLNSSGNGCGNGILGNLFGNGNRYGCGCGGDNEPITRYEAGLLLSMNAKDSEIANLKSDRYTDQKIVDTTTYLMGKIEDLRSQVAANKDAQSAINMQQSVYNGTNTATIANLQGQIAQLQGLSQLVVPQRNVCNTCCGCPCVS